MTQQCSQTEASAGYGQGKLSVLWRMRKHAEHWGQIGRKLATGKVQPIACYRYVTLRDVIGNSPTTGLSLGGGWFVLLCVVTLAEVWGSRKRLLWGRATWAGEQRAGQRIQVETSPALFRYGHGHAELCFVLVHADVSNVDETNNKQGGHRSWEEVPWGEQSKSSTMIREMLMRNQSSWIGRNV